MVDVTNFDTAAGSKEFIAGLAEGTEFTVECNFIAGASSHQAAVRADKGNTRNFELTYTGSSPNMIWTGECVNQGWVMDPNLTEQNKITFTFKVSGAITETP